MLDKEPTIASDFPVVEYDEWRRQAEKDLKGIPFEKKMITHTLEGIDIQALYLRNDWPSDGDPSGFPGFPTFVRGAGVLGHALSGWDIRQELRRPLPEEANRIALEELGHGVSSLHAHFDAAVCRGLDPDDPESADLCGREEVMTYCLGDFETLFADVDLSVASVALDARGAFIPTAALMVSLMRKRNIALSDVQCCFGADPLGALVACGSLPFSMEDSLRLMADLAAWTAEEAPKATAIRVSTVPYHHAGASSTQDVAFAVATAVEYLRVMTSAGMDIDSAIRMIAFHDAAGCKFFQAIAKIRALRKVWSKVTRECGGSPEAGSSMRLTVQTSRRVMTRRDPWVNLLRNTAACFAAAIGGADAVTTLPMDAAIGLSDEFTRHLARNTQLILLEESQLNRVIDPAGGSWFLESLTDRIAEEAWGIFRSIDARGGMIKATMDGWTAEQIEAVERIREKDAAVRKRGVTGVSEHPDVFEKEIVRPAPDYAQLRAASSARLMRWRRDHGAAWELDALRQKAQDRDAKPGDLMRAAIAAAKKGATVGQLTAMSAQTGKIDDSAHVARLKVHPYAAAYEAMRDAADRYAAGPDGKRPKVFLANLGAPKEYLARSTYSLNFFEAGGFEPVSGEGTDDPQVLAEAFAKSGASIAVLCSTDARYKTDVERVAPALRSAGVRTLILAGHREPMRLVIARPE
jgi:methylmalonyl-CoA mutase